VAQGIASRFHLPFRRLDWSGNQPHDAGTLVDLFHTYGFQYEIHGAPEGLIDTFNGMSARDCVLVMGGRGPVLTQKEPWALPEASYPFDRLVDFVMSKSIQNEDFRYRDEYARVLAADVREGLAHAHIPYPSEGAPRDVFVRAFLHLYLRSEARFLNFANEFCHYLTPFIMKPLHDPLLSVPPRFRVGHEFQIRLIHALVPELLEVPLYSGYKLKQIDRKSFCAHNIEETSVLGRVADVVLPAFLRQPTTRLYHRLVPSRKHRHRSPDRNDAILGAYGPAILADPVLGRYFASTEHLVPGARLKILARLHHYSVGVNDLGYSLPDTDSAAEQR
jgi:hypothetical protein